MSIVICTKLFSKSYISLPATGRQTYWQAGSQRLHNFDIILQVVAEVRKYKTEKQMSLGAEIDTLTISASADQLAILQSVEDDIVGVTKATKIVYTEGEWRIDIG